MAIFFITDSEGLDWRGGYNSFLFQSLRKCERKKRDSGEFDTEGEIFKEVIVRRSNFRLKLNDFNSNQIKLAEGWGGALRWLN